MQSQEADMLKEERQQLILNTLKSNGRVVATELSQRLEVSEDTIRRDLRDLAEAGQLVRVHGGGLPASPATATYAERLHQAPEAKRAIASAALQLIKNGQVILMDGGTTTLQVAQQLPPDLQATIITNSPLIATELAPHPGIEIMLIGGTVYKHSLVTIGTAAVEALRSLHTDLCLLGVCSLDPEAGITVPDLEETFVKRAMIASARQVAALASAEKLGTAATHFVAPITALTHLVTEDSVAEEQLDAYRAAGVTILRAAHP
jgi:DeoR/GlpR family transcriptional regulator of sugar metabolism